MLSHTELLEVDRFAPADKISDLCDYLRDTGQVHVAESIELHLYYLIHHIVEV